MKTWIIILLGVFFLILALVLGYDGETADEGDTIAVNYTITLEDGSIYYTNFGDDPLTGTLGEGKFITGFEEAVVGMRPGELKTVTVPPDKAYGPYRRDLIGPISRDRLPADLEPAIGQRLQTQLDDGTQAVTVITDIADTTITVDANHPLAGRSLTFDIELVALEKNQAFTGRLDARWVIAAAIVVAVGLFVAYFRGRWRLQLVRVSGRGN